MFKQYWSSQKKSYKLLDIEQKSEDCFEGGQGSFLADYSFIQSEFSNMLGKVLTIIDASIIEPKQNKAVKDIIRNDFVEEYTHLTDVLYTQEKLDEITPEFTDEEIEKMGETSIEEVAGH